MKHNELLGAITLELMDRMDSHAWEDFTKKDWQEIVSGEAPTEYARGALAFYGYIIFALCSTAENDFTPSEVQAWATQKVCLYMLRQGIEGGHVDASLLPDLGFMGEIEPVEGSLCIPAAKAMTEALCNEFGVRDWEALPEAAREIITGVRSLVPAFRPNYEALGL